MNKHRFLTGTVIVALLLAITGLTYAQGPGLESDLKPQAAVGTDFTYQGRLTDGASPADGPYDFRFTLYNAASGGSKVGSTLSRGDVGVSEGLFTVKLDFGDVFDGTALWMQVEVRPGSSTGTYTPLSPRQALTAAPYALYAAKVPAHDHWGETWEGETGFFAVRNTATGNEAYLPGLLSGVYGHSDTWGGVHGQSTSNIGVYGQSVEATGVYGDSIDGHGVTAESDNSHSLYVPSAGASGIYVEGAATHGVHVEGAGSNGVDVASAGGSGVQVYSAGHDGVRVHSANWSGVYVASSGADALRVQTAGQDGLRLFDAMGRDYIRAGDDGNLEFRVENDGTVRADGGFLTGADFAELMTTEASPEVYEPGDVLVISVESDRSAAFSSKPYSTLVLGIYSENPGFVGSLHPMEDQSENEIPVAIVGIVPCKVSAENGPVHRGDLLVTSSTPGHAMRADDAPAGTILGKALESLEEGTGLIQVLVTLQ